MIIKSCGNERWYVFALEADPLQQSALMRCTFGSEYYSTLPLTFILYPLSEMYPPTSDGASQRILKDVVPMLSIRTFSGGAQGCVAMGDVSGLLEESPITHMYLQI